MSVRINKKMSGYKLYIITILSQNNNNLKICFIHLLMVEEKKESIEPEIFDKFEKTVKELTKTRGNPLLIMFYSDPAGQILPSDIKALEDVFDDFLEVKKKEGFKELDLLIHTHGGEAHTSYRLIQLIRSYCKRLNVLVATHAHSGGTLIAFGANKVEMGRSATLSPVDVEIGSGEENEEPLAILSIQKYLEFLEDCSSKIYNIEDEKNKMIFITELTKRLMDEICPSKLGELFRLRSLTNQHSKTLLHNYMFKNISEKKNIAEMIISKFTKESPTHQFLMDYELVKESGLIVEKMDKKVYKLCKDLIYMLMQLKRGGVICHFYPASITKRRPFLKIFDVNK